MSEQVQGSTPMESIDKVLGAADALADAVLSWESHVTLEGLTGAYRAARKAALQAPDEPNPKGRIA